MLNKQQKTSNRITLFSFKIENNNNDNDAKKCGENDQKISELQKIIKHRKNQVVLIICRDYLDNAETVWRVILFIETLC